LASFFRHAKRAFSGDRAGILVGGDDLGCFDSLVKEQGGAGRFPPRCAGTRRQQRRPIDHPYTKLFEQKSSEKSAEPPNVPPGRHLRGVFSFPARRGCTVR
jgi:hypothetical protein